MLNSTTRWIQQQPGYQMNSSVSKCWIPRQDGFNMISVRTIYCKLSQSGYKMDSIIAKHDNSCQRYCQRMWFLSWSIKLPNRGPPVCCNHHHVLSSFMIDNLFLSGFVLLDLWYSMEYVVHYCVLPILKQSHCIVCLPITASD